MSERARLTDFGVAGGVLASPQPAPAFREEIFAASVGMESSGRLRS
ncbi:hypothetical protein [Leifsonia sp. P73]